MLVILDDNILPENLAYLRKKRGLSQIKLSRQTGINVYLLRGIEKGRFRAQLPCEQRLRLCNALCISPMVMGTQPLPQKDCSPPLKKS